MIFLIEYDRPRGELVSMRSYDEGDRSSAEKARLELELNLLEQGIEREVVVLQSTNENTLRRAYRRYFESLNEIANAFADEAGTVSPKQ